MYVIDEPLAVRARPPDNPKDATIYEKYDPKTDTFIEDFDVVLDVLMGFEPFTDGTEYGWDNRVVDVTEFDAFVYQQRQRYLAKQ